MKRTFIAFNIVLSGLTKTVYKAVRQKLRTERINWVEPDNFHITIRFLGDSNEEIIPAIIKSIENALAGCSPFTVSMNGLGVFKNIADPRVIWIGCKSDDSLVQIKKKIDAELLKYGFKYDTQKFTPHVTLGRIKLIRQTNGLSELITKYKDSGFQQLQVKEIILYESLLMPEGAKYTSVHKFRLS